MTDNNDDDDDNNNEDGFEAVMKTLRAEFRAGLIDRDTALAQAWGAWREATADDARNEAFQRLRARAHKLAGSSRTFGQAAIGEAADALELALITLEEPPAIAALVERVRTAIAAAVAAADTAA